MVERKSQRPLFASANFYLAFKQKVIPVLKTYSSVRLWYMGCSRVEDLYSLAILLYEEGMTKKCRIYATDKDQKSIERAQKGSFLLTLLDDSAVNYQKAGGNGNFFDYFFKKRGRAVIADSLKENISFFRYHLLKESSFNEFHVIICRDMVAHFDPENIPEIHKIFTDSLIRFGILGLGDGESINSSGFKDCFRPLDTQTSLFKRIA